MSMTLNFPPPSHWQDFQILTYRIVEQMCNPNTARGYGRNGQKENGVDVYGELAGDFHLGVQCKKIGSGHKLTKKIIEDEAKEALSFIPKLHTFVVATTQNEDTAIHKAVTALNQSKTYPFKISYWSWGYFNDRLNRSNKLVAETYHDYAKAFGFDLQIRDLQAIHDGFIRNAFTDDFAYELCCNAFLDALNDMVFFLQSGLLRDRLSQDLVSSTYPFSLMPDGPNKRLRKELIKEVKSLRSSALVDHKAGRLNQANGPAYNAKRGAIIALINRDLAASSLPLIQTAYRI